MIAAVNSSEVPSVRLVWRALWSRPVLAFAALAITVAVVILTSWPKQRISAANFEKIEIGMSQAELYGLLGAPGHDSLLFGKVEGPKTFFWGSLVRNKPEEWAIGIIGFSNGPLPRSLSSRFLMNKGKLSAGTRVKDDPGTGSCFCVVSNFGS